MSDASRMRPVFLFCLKFILVVPVCLVAWWGMVPAYTWGIGHLTSATLTAAAGADITGTAVERKGILNTGTELVFTVGGARRGMPITQVVSNVAPFLALVLATAGLSLRRRCAILAIGTGILILGHWAYLVFAFIFASRISASPHLPTALAQLFLTLPFLLWITLAYWGGLADLFGQEQDRSDGSDRSDRSVG
jgi:hypothetical protein